MHKKNKKLLIVLAVIALVSIAAVAAVLSYNHVDHSRFMDKTEIATYNSAIATTARRGGYISAEEFVLIERVGKEQGGHTTVTFRVYRLPDGDALSAYSDLRVRDVPADFVPEEMGTGTAKLLNDSLERILITVTYSK